MKIKLRFGRKTFLMLKSSPQFRGWRFQSGPFGCWNLYLGRVRIGWELSRWL